MKKETPNPQGSLIQATFGVESVVGTGLSPLLQLPHQDPVAGQERKRGDMTPAGATRGGAHQVQTMVLFSSSEAKSTRAFSPLLMTTTQVQSLIERNGVGVGVGVGIGVGVGAGIGARSGGAAIGAT
jgi:hypothetical protein